MSTETTTVYDEIRAERERQDELNGGTTHDDTHGPHDWIAFICKHAGLASIRRGYSFNPTAFRKGMITVAALAVAAIQWTDRLQKDDGQ